MWSCCLIFVWGILLLEGHALNMKSNFRPLGRYSRGYPGSLREKRDEVEQSSGAYGRGVSFYVGEPCSSSCNNILHNVYCNGTTGKCECEPKYPVNIKNRMCVKEVALGHKCEYTESCSARAPGAICQDLVCRCSEGFYEKIVEKGIFTCSPGVTTGFANNSDVTTMISVIAGLIVFTGLFCLVLRLFSKQRFNQPRGQVSSDGVPPLVMTGIENTPPRRSSVASSRRLSRSSVASNEFLPASRRASCGMLVPPSNSGSRRASSASVRSQSSLRSYASFRSQSSFRSYRSARDPVRRTASSPADAPTPLTTSLTFGRRSPFGTSAKMLAPTTEVPFPVTTTISIPK